MSEETSAPAWGEPRQLNGGGEAVVCFYCGHMLILAEGETVISVCPVCHQDGEKAAQIAAIRGLLWPMGLTLRHAAGDPGYLILEDPDTNPRPTYIAGGRGLLELLGTILARLHPSVRALVHAEGAWVSWPEDGPHRAYADLLVANNSQIEREGPRWRVRPIWTPTTPVPSEVPRA